MELKKFISLISAAAITASAFSTLGVYAESEDAAGTNETEVSQRVSEDNSGKTASVEEELVSPAAYDTSDAVENSADTEKDVSNESMPKATLRPEPNDGAVEVTAEPQPSSDVQLAAESNWNAYTAAYDSDGRLTAIYKTSDIVPSDADTSINYEMLKTFVWDDNCIPYINSNEVMFKKDDYRCIRNNDGEGYSIMVYLDDIKSKYVSYKLSSDLKICINGKEYTYTIEDIEKFITSNYLGNVTLRDIPNAESGETDGIYDEIDIQYFLDGCIEEVTAGDYGRYSICFDKYEYEMGREILVLDEYKNYSIKLNGKEISPSELKQGDVLSVAYDIKGNFHNSDDYEIYVSRETKHLNVTDVFDDDSNQKITAADGKTYVTAYADAANMSAAKEYEVGFDIFGKIAYANEITSPVQYAILENLYATNGGIDYYADIITASGEKKSYPVTKDDYDAFINILMMDSEKFDTDEKLLNRQEPQNRVIEYVINSKGELNVKRTVYPWIFEGEYDAESNRLDGNKLDSEVSKILDISDYRNDESRGYPAVSLSDFRDSISYKGYVFGMTSNGSYQFVIITSGIGGYHVTDGWGVYVTGEKVSTPDGYKDAVTAYVNSELKTIPIDVPDEDLSTGDIFFYTTNPDGYIDDIRKVSSTGYTYRDMFKKAIDSNFDIINSETAEQFSGSSSKNNFAQDNCSPNMLVSGFIINNYGLSVTMATKYDLSKNNTITAFDLDRCKEYYFANDMTVYKYDYSVGNLKNRISTAKKTDIESLRFFGNSYVDNALNF